MVALNGIRVLVTGATSGLGAAMAGALAGAGARVMVTSRDRARAQATAAELGPSALPCELDVRDERSVAACVDRARKAWGGIDMLVNNAGIGMRTVNPRFMSEPQPFWAVDPAGFRDVVDTKVVGCFLMARAVVPLMLRESGGRVVNISMNEQTMVRRGFVPYGPAGAGVE
ncbi:MAG TPA: SDR family oxidoreductase, partial [Acidimicrobiales bacterium]|nr:SDR family oxidoreductase [Acidimicrobiales bacterium]